MIRLSSVIDTFTPDFLAHYRDKLTSDHLRALAAMQRCRTKASPKMQVQCSGCEHQILVPHSCGHRHCPHCQHHESQQWLARAHQNVIYDLLMRCSWETVRTFSQNDKQLQGTPGAIAVLHTNTRQLDYHPHVHLVMPAAAVNGKQKKWRIKRRGTGKGKSKGVYLFNEKALAKVFRAKFLAGIEAAALTLPSHYPKEWVMNCKSVGTGEKALIYLGRYIYRGVIREKDIVASKDGQVTFRYRNGKTGKMERRTVSGADFLWRVLQHVLPKGFRRARNFGFLHSNCKRLIALLHVVLKFNPGQASDWIKERAPILCTCCGAVMKIVRTRIRSLFSGPMPIPIAARGAC